MSALPGRLPDVALLPPRQREAVTCTFRRILVASDGSDAALGALRVANALAAAGPRRTEDADREDATREPAVAVVAVTEPESTSPHLQARLGARMDRRLALVHAQLGAVGERALAWPVSAPVGDPVAEIVRAADACDAELIVLGLGRRIAADRILGAEAALHVAERAAVPVLAVPAAATGRPRIGVCGVDADDGGATARIAAARAAAVLDPAGTLCLVHVVAFEDGDPEHDGGRERRRLDSVADAVRACEGGSPVRVEIVELRGTPADALLEFAHERGADLLVVARAARRPVSADEARLTACFRGATSAVLVVPPAPAADDAD